MKLAKVIARYFYQSQQMNIKGLGSFSGVPGSSETEIAANGINFTYNPKVETDDALVSFIVQETGKMKPLAISDLDSFVEDGKQLLNIGKPFYIEGLGAVQKNRLAEWEFVAGPMVSEKASIDLENERKLRTELQETPQRKVVDYITTEEAVEKKGVNWGRVIMAFGVVGALGAGGYFAYNYLLKPKAGAQNNVVKQEANNNSSNGDTINNNQNFVDTAKQKRDSIAALQASIKPVGITTLPDGKIKYGIVCKFFANKAEADAFAARGITYKDAKIEVAPLDGIKYKAYIPFVSAVADSGVNRKAVMSYMQLDSTQVYIDK
jgi:hypothetical protein